MTIRKHQTADDVVQLYRNLKEADRDRVLKELAELPSERNRISRVVWLKLAEAAVILGRSKSQITRYVQRGKLRSNELRHAKLRVRADEVMNLLVSRARHVIRRHAEDVRAYTKARWVINWYSMKPRFHELMERLCPGYFDITALLPRRGGHLPDHLPGNQESAWREFDEFMNTPSNVEQGSEFSDRERQVLKKFRWAWRQLSLEPEASQPSLYCEKCRALWSGHRSHA